MRNFSQFLASDKLFKSVDKFNTATEQNFVPCFHENVEYYLIFWQHE